MAGAAVQCTFALTVPRTSGPSKLAQELPEMGRIPGGPLKEPEPLRVPPVMLTGKPVARTAVLEHPATGTGPRVALKVIFTPPGEPAAVSPGWSVPEPEMIGQVAVPVATGAAHATPGAARLTRARVRAGTMTFTMVGRIISSPLDKRRPSVTISPLDERHSNV
jgi:hypothetical protein